MACLSDDDRTFFNQARQLATANPFGRDREEGDRTLSLAPTGLERDGVIDRMLEVVHRRLAALGPFDVRRYPPGEGQTLQVVLLFSLFHELAPELDQRIEDEVAGRKGRPLVAVEQTLARLEAHGLRPDEADHYIAIVWQARRAYHFIARMLVGSGVSMRRLRESLWNNIFTHDLLRYATILHRGMEDFSTFILGETGTGKTAAAAAIGRSGYIPFDRTNNDFVASFTECFLAANLSAIPSTLLESELFGHAKGAFTGAVEAHRGLFSRCSPHGSIFLDEIGEVSLQVQIKLLHVLQDRKFSPVGSHDVQRFEGRVIVATNRSLEEMAASGSLRADLFYRLSSDVIEVPSLQDRFRESPEELSQMVDSLLERMLGEADSSLSEQVLAIIARDIAPDYAWPGNVRELEQCIRRILLRGDAAPSWPHRGSRASGSTYLWQATEEGQWPVQALIEAYCRLVYEHEGSYEQAGQRLGLDWRTVKRHVQATG